jgi:hypothetical protein
MLADEATTTTTTFDFKGISDAAQKCLQVHYKHMQLAAAQKSYKESQMQAEAFLLFWSQLYHMKTRDSNGQTLPMPFLSAMKMTPKTYTEYVLPIPTEGNENEQVHRIVRCIQQIQITHKIEVASRPADEDIQGFSLGTSGWSAVLAWNTECAKWHKKFDVHELKIHDLHAKSAQGTFIKAVQKFQSSDGIPKLYWDELWELVDTLLSHYFSKQSNTWRDKLGALCSQVHRATQALCPTMPVPLPPLDDASDVPASPGGRLKVAKKKAKDALVPPDVVTIDCGGYTQGLEVPLGVLPWLFSQWSPCVLLHGLGSQQIRDVYAGIKAAYYIVQRLAGDVQAKGKNKFTFMVFKNKVAFDKWDKLQTGPVDEQDAHATWEYFTTKNNQRFDFGADIDLVQRIRRKFKNDPPNVWCLRAGNVPVMAVLFGLLGSRSALCALHSYVMINL